MSILQRHNVRELGSSSAQRTIVFAHGYGCDQGVWQQVAPAFAADHRIVLFDYAGCGDASPTAYDFERHATLSGHAQDLLDVCDSVQARRPVLVAHSVSTMIGVVASTMRPDYFSALVLVAPSPSYLNEGGYAGGFTRDDIDSLLQTLDAITLDGPA